MKSDKKVNSAPFYVLQPGQRWHLEEKQSQELVVGSLLYLESGDRLPADAILLRVHTSSLIIVFLLFDAAGVCSQ